MAKKKKNAASGDELELAAGDSKKKGKSKPEKKGGKISRGIASPVRNLIITAVVSVLLGLAFFLKPYEVSLYSSYGVGGLLALVGIIYILIYFLRKPVSGVFRSEFVIGLVALLAGAYVALSVLLSPTSSTSYSTSSTVTAGGIGYVMIIRVIGVLIAADGLLKVQYAVDIGRMKFKGWWVALIFAVLSIGIGVLTATDFSGKAITAQVNEPLSFIYPLGYTLGLGSSFRTYGDFYVRLYGGLKMLGIAFMANGVLDLATLIVIAIRNHKAAREEAIAKASEMIAEKKKEEVALPEETAEEASEEFEEIVFAPEPAPEPEPVAAPEPAPEAPAEPAAEE